MKTQTTKWTPKPRDTGTFSMWLCLPMGQYGISHRWPGSYDAGTDPRDIMIRTRKAKYLSRLRASYIPELGEDEGRTKDGTDYGHRAFCTAREVDTMTEFVTCPRCEGKGVIPLADLHRYEDAPRVRAELWRRLGATTAKSRCLFR